MEVMRNSSQRGTSKFVKRTTPVTGQFFQSSKEEVVFPVGRRFSLHKNDEKLAKTQLEIPTCFLPHLD